jgi:hypothetical protein
LDDSQSLASAVAEILDRTRSDRTPREQYEQDPAITAQVQWLFSHEPRLPEVLRRAAIRGRDQTEELFLATLVGAVHENTLAPVANVCSGSGALSDALCASDLVRPSDVTNIDSSRNMLNSSKYHGIQADLSVPNHFTHQFRTILLAGSLRYFWKSMECLALNLARLRSCQSVLVAADIHASLVRRLSAELDIVGFDGRCETKRATVFRNTIFYLLLYEYRHRNSFRELVDRRSSESFDHFDVLIEAAGFKDVDYFYYVGVSQ